jgi:hypothetical protein
MTRSVFVLLFFLASLAGQPLLAAEDGADKVAESGMPAEQAAADTDKSDSGKKPAKPEDEEPECD